MAMAASVSNSSGGRLNESGAPPPMTMAARIGERAPGLVGNRLVPDDAMWQALSGLLSETMLVSRPELVEHLATLSDVCALGLSGFVRTLGRFALGRERLVEAAALRVKRLSVKSFMDPWTLNVERLKQCCIHVASTDPAAPVVRIPFCARQAFGALRERTAAGMVGRAAVARSAVARSAR